MGRAPKPIVCDEASGADSRMAIPPTTSTDYAALFALDDERLLELLRSLEPADWSRPTPCPAWDVHGLALHLLGSSLSVVSWHRDGHRGTPAPAGVDEHGFIAWLDELQAGWVDAARRISPRLLVELSAWVAVAFGETMAALDPSAVTADVSWASDGPVPVWLDQARELTEHWIHRQQLLEALERPADLRDDLCVPVLEALRWAYPYRLRDEMRPPGSTVEFRIDHDGDAQLWRLVCDGRSWSFDELATTDVVASVHLSRDQAWRLLTNNYRPDLHGPYRTAGDHTLLARIASTRAIIGDPQ